VFIFAKLVQALGVADVGFAFYIGLTHENALRMETLLFASGVLVFYLGRYVERRFS
jgi:hypothetical protein